MLKGGSVTTLVTDVVCGTMCNNKSNVKECILKLHRDDASVMYGADPCLQFGTFAIYQNSQDYGRAFVLLNAAAGAVGVYKRAILANPNTKELWEAARDAMNALEQRFPFAVNDAGFKDGCDLTDVMTNAKLIGFACEAAMLYYGGEHNVEAVLQEMAEINIKAADHALLDTARIVAYRRVVQCRGALDAADKILANESDKVVVGGQDPPEDYTDSMVTAIVLAKAIPPEMMLSAKLNDRIETCKSTLDRHYPGELDKKMTIMTANLLGADVHV